MQNYTPTGSSFKAAVREFDTSDRAHADVLNLAVEDLAENAQFLKNKQGDLSDLDTTEQGSIVEAINEVKDIVSRVIYDSAGAHNAIYRGKNLGTSVTTAQYNAIAAGTFDDMFIGDYWVINNVTWRIAAFDYWLHCGDTECTTHHVVLVPDTNLNNQKMNSSNVTTGGYVGSEMYTTNITAARNAIVSAFGSAHILSHRELFSNAISSNSASGWAWYDSTIDLMNETMVYGHEANSSKNDGALNYNVGIDKTQLPLFHFDPSRITNRAAWWLRSVVSSADFAFVNGYGVAYSGGASDSAGVRPAFAICAA